MRRGRPDSEPMATRSSLRPRKALRAAAEIRVVLDKEKFYQIMELHGAGRIVSELYLRTCEIENDVFFTTNGEPQRI